MYFKNHPNELFDFYRSSKLEYCCVCCGKKYKDIYSNQHCECTSKYYNTIISNKMSFFNTPILGEGDTPLVFSKKLSDSFSYEIYLKDETFNPTGSFKDRETAYIFSTISKNSSVHIVSSGNAAISALVYGSKLGIKCSCHIPNETSIKKRDLLSKLNGKLCIHDGTYEEIYESLVDELKDKINITSGQMIDRELGTSSLVQEVFDSGVFPQAIVMPAGNGALLFGVFIGCLELLLAGKINQLPKLFGVQIKGHAPLAEALKLDKSFVRLNKRPRGICEAILADASYCSPKALLGVNLSKGSIIQVDEDEVLFAKEQLDTLGYSVEESSASALASIAYLDKYIPKKTKVLLILSGSFQKKGLI